MRHVEIHRTHRVGWLWAAVLGANDGSVCTASLVLGVAAAEASQNAVLTAGIAGLVAGAMPMAAGEMAAGEYVSVSSQKDTEKADLDRERAELKNDPELEHAELAATYVERGVDRETAERVAKQMMAHDSLAAHAREELGISDLSTARPVQAALASACAFAIGAAMPLAVAALGPIETVTPAVAGTSLVFLALLGAVAARAGGAGAVVGIARVTVWGALAMGFTTAVDRFFGDTNSTKPGFLIPDTIKQSPLDPLDGGGGTNLRDWVNLNEAAILAERHSVPLEFNALPFRAARTKYFDGTFFTAAGILDPEARRSMSFNACAGCHAAEALDPSVVIGPAGLNAIPPMSASLTNFPESFYHVDARTTAGFPVRLSRFMTGTLDTTPNTPIPDPAGSPLAPRHFDDLARRGQVVQSLATNQCIFMGGVAFILNSGALTSVH